MCKVMTDLSKGLILVCAVLLCSAKAMAQPLVHPKLQDSIVSADGNVMVKLIDRKQNYSGEKGTFDSDINSPKSVNIHPNGKKYYVNSLEGCSTIAYDFTNRKKIKVIRHVFDEQRDAALWSEPSGLFEWKHYSRNTNTFSGKPVESTFSHNGRYLWIPYYRRSFDIIAQDPSAVAIIDTETDSIVRLMETGPLPKMITTSPDGKIVAISLWGNNTVGLIDISSANPKDWKYICKLVVDHELQLNYPLNVSVDRDNGSGYALRGTVFTPDNKYLLVGCMGGGGGIAVIDIARRAYMGRVLGMMSNVRHLVLSNGYLYLSINGGGAVQRCKLADFIAAAEQMKNNVASFTQWETVKVGTGARTIGITANGRYIFAACNNVSKLYVVDTQSMSVIGSINADSYPVGLDISSDDRYVFLTSQGRGHQGGNCVDIFEVKYNVDMSERFCVACGAKLDAAKSSCPKCNLDLLAASCGSMHVEADTAQVADEEITENAQDDESGEGNNTYLTAGIVIGGIALLGAGALFVKSRKNKS